MDIHGFAAALARRVERQVPRAHLKNEREFERKHVEEPAWELSEKHPEVRVLVHLEKGRKKCEGGCDAGAADPSRRVQRCPGCWKASKKWSVDQKRPKSEISVKTDGAFIRGIYAGRLRPPLRK